MPSFRVLHCYALNEKGEPVHEPDFLRWSFWFQQAQLLMAHSVADEVVDGLRVSTVFLGLDRNFEGKGPPILWETMVFGSDGVTSQDDADPRAGRQDRCSGTRKQAEAMHASMVAWVRAYSKNPM